MADEQAVHAWLAAQGAQRDFVAWAEAFGADVGALWRACPRGDWLLAMAARLQAEPRALVLAACGCAEGALEHLPPDETSVQACLEAIRGWALGTGYALSVDAIERMRNALEAARDAARDPAHAEATLAAIAALETLGDPAFAASAAAFAAQATTVSAADCGMLEAMRFAQHQTAQSVRSVLSDQAVRELWSGRPR